MTIIQAVILGIIQGITEFLPISSSGHLVLIPFFLGWEIDPEYVFIFDVLVQLGTFIAILVYYWKDLIEIGRDMWAGIHAKKPFHTTPARVGWYALFATIPAGLSGILLKARIENAFNRPDMVAFFLFITAGLLGLAELKGKGHKDIESMDLYDALWIGVFQVLSLFPGISRSGSTIAGGMTRGINRKDAGSFSFLMAIPVLAAAGLLGIIDLMNLAVVDSFLPALILGGLSAAVVGYISIRWLLNYLNSHSLVPFIFYCILLGVSTLLFNHFETLPKRSIAAEANTVTETYRVAIDPELEWMLPTINHCTRVNGNYLIQTQTYDDEIFDDEDIFFSMGEIVSEHAYTYQIGKQAIKPVANADADIQLLSGNLMKKISSGEVHSWDQAQELCDACFQNSDQISSQPIDLLIHPLESPISKEIQENMMGGASFSTFATLVPSSKLMVQEINRNINSIGFLPEKWIDSSIKEIKWTNERTESLSVPVLVYSTIEPEGDLEVFLTCVQNASE